MDTVLFLANGNSWPANQMVPGEGGTNDQRELTLLMELVQHFAALSPGTGRTSACTPFLRVSCVSSTALVAHTQVIYWETQQAVGILSNRNVNIKYHQPKAFILWKATESHLQITNRGYDGAHLIAVKFCFNNNLFFLIKTYLPKSAGFFKVDRSVFCSHWST